MKRKLLVTICLITMLAMMLAGCGKKDSETTKDAVYLTFDGYGMIMGTLSFTENGEASESVAVSFEGEPGQKISKLWKDSGYKDMQPFCEGEVFEGWMEYKTNRETDENGIDTYNYERISGDTLLTTEELMGLSVPDYDVMYVAKWESISMEDYDLTYAELSGNEEFTETQDIYLLLNADGGVMAFEGEESFETDVYLYYLAEGKTIQENMEAEGNDAMSTVKKDGAEFTGWTIYEGDFSEWPEGEPEELKDGAQYFEAGGYMNIVLDNCEVYSEMASMDELKQILCEDKTYYAVANWE